MASTQEKEQKQRFLSCLPSALRSGYCMHRQNVQIIKEENQEFSGYNDSAKNVLDKSGYSAEYQPKIKQSFLEKSSQLHSQVQNLFQDGMRVSRMWAPNSAVNEKHEDLPQQDEQKSAHQFERDAETIADAVLASFANDILIGEGLTTPRRSSLFSVPGEDSPRLSSDWLDFDQNEDGQTQDEQPTHEKKWIDYCGLLPSEQLVLSFAFIPTIDDGEFLNRIFVEDISLPTYFHSYKLETSLYLCK